MKRQTKRAPKETAATAGKKTGRSLRIFAHDPGSKNYGYSIIEGTKVGHRVKARILVNGLCPCPLHNLKDHAIRQRQRTKYLEWVGKLIRKYKIDGIYAERYMSRGMGGPTIESVNMMLGLLQSFQLPDRYIPAAVWKNAVRRQGVDLKLEYKICRSAPHQLDASLIGLYGLHQAFCIKDFGSMGRRAFVAYTNQVEKTSKAKLYNRKAKR